MEKFEHHNEEPGTTGVMATEYDVATGRVDVRCTGFWSIRQTNAYFSDWETMVRRIHGAGRFVAALVDLSQSAVQKAEVAEKIATGTVGLYRPGDAVAMLVPTSLAKMQMRRVLDEQVHSFFMSRAAAELWLSAKSGPSSSAAA